MRAERGRRRASPGEPAALPSCPRQAPSDRLCQLTEFGGCQNFSASRCLVFKARDAPRRCRGPGGRVTGKRRRPSAAAGAPSPPGGGRWQREERAGRGGCAELSAGARVRPPERGARSGAGARGPPPPRRAPHAFRKAPRDPLLDRRIKGKKKKSKKSEFKTFFNFLAALPPLLPPRPPAPLLPTSSRSGGAGRSVSGLQHQSMAEAGDENRPPQSIQRL